MKIGIAGAGIGGLAAAALLARDGHQVTIFDQFDQPRPVGSGLVIQPVGQHVLDIAGAGDAARAKGAQIHQMLGLEVIHQKPVLDVTYDPAGQGHHGLAIHRASLFDALLDAVSVAETDLQPSSRIIATHLGSEGRRLEHADGTQSQAFDLVIDASGATSALSPLRGKTLPYGAIWGTVPWPDGTDLPPTQLSQRYRYAEHMIGVLPIGALPGADTPMAAIFWSMPEGDHDTWRAAPLDQWKAEAMTLWPAMAPFLETVQRHDDMTMARYTHGTLNTPVAERLVYLGDAAHRASPQLGQGANMALLDAYALAWSLRQSNDLTNALALYVRTRRWHVRIYQAMSWAFTPQYQSDSRTLPWIRDNIMMPVSRIPPVPRILSALVCGTLVTPVAGEPYAHGRPAGLAQPSTANAE
ncbi:NAD(P)/FAD-dependent oxidoreductase [Actibacterium sp. 188UL27-1]|uniref:FAD-dependent oxidoreductase n=1 Tax=Actibacterium sp. 188UL27-1 TaxID=2786961 RepID=UPI001958F046|nr:NAD(P)/FAD-dependent oxidoreductase [Actibacterium sp. 188UL27-1]MBM7068760.1 FAD-dependent monooxygenase [Actibacterium sp. 188UL27-1]